MDTYPDFATLARHEVEGRDFDVLFRVASSGILVVAPHGGRIEPGTFEIADAIAGREHSLYGFRGIRAADNARLHLTSRRFDEPRCDRLVRRAQLVLTVHGCRLHRNRVLVGGRATALRHRLATRLTRAGFPAEGSLRGDLRGMDAANICNRGSTGAGIQLEISAGLRRLLTGDPADAGATGDPGLRLRFAAAVREVLAAMG